MEKSSNVIQFVRNFSTMLARSNLANALGTGFAGKRDYYTIFGYKQKLLYNDLLFKYSRQGLASRIIEAPAQALWNNPPIVSSNDEEWNQAWNKLISKQSLWESILRVDKLCGLGRYACLFIGTNGTWTPESPATIGKKSELNEVIYFQPFSQSSAKIQDFEDKPNSPQFNLPKTYTIAPLSNDLGIMDASVKVPNTSFRAHYTRVLHVAENTLENSVYGSPRLERVFNDLDDMLKVSGGTAETYWTVSNRGMQVDVDKEMELTPEDAKDLSDEIDEFMHQIRRVIRTRGVKINNLGSDTPEPKQTFDMIISLLSGATGIPRRILIGAEAGQLASEQDRANWAERIKSRRKEFAEPIIIFPLISKLTNLGVLPKKDNVDITVDWPDAYQLSPLEIAQKAAQHARSATNFAKSFETMAKLTQGTEAIPEQIDGEGNPIPGTGQAAKPAVLEGELISIKEAREMMTLEAPKAQIDDVGDIQE